MQLGHIYQSRHSNGDGWLFNWTRDEHNYEPQSDPFILIQHKESKLIMLCAGTICYIRRRYKHTASAKLVWEEELHIVTKSHFYDLKRGVDQGETLSKRREIALIMAYLEEEGFQVDSRSLALSAGRVW